MDFEWTALLAEQRVQALLKDALATEMELLPLSAKLAKTYAPAERAAIMDYYALLPRIFEKFGTDKFLLCDRLALEQSTAKDIAEWKARLFPGNCSVNDLCCGMGGDTFALPGTVEVKGADLSAARRAMYAYNTAALGLPREAVDADARTLDNGADFFEIDPARRGSEGGITTGRIRVVHAVILKAAGHISPTATNLYSIGGNNAVFLATDIT